MHHFPYLSAKRILLASMASILLGCSDGKDPKVEEVGSLESPKEASSHPWDWVPTSSDLKAGKEVYLKECALCHNEGEEGAPALTDQEEWNQRVTKGVDTLVLRAIEGFTGSDGEMPARGGSDYLTDEEVTGAVHFMAAASVR